MQGKPTEGAHKRPCKEQGCEGPFVRPLALQGVPRKASGLEAQVVTVQTAVGFVIFASLMLVLLYFFLNHILAIVLVSSHLTRSGNMSVMIASCMVKECMIALQVQPLLSLQAAWGAHPLVLELVWQTMITITQAFLTRFCSHRQ